MILAPLAAVLLLTLNPFAGLGQDRDAAAQEEPPTAEERQAQREAALDRLYGELAAAENAEAAAATAAQIETLWEGSGSATADLLMERATQAMIAEDPDMAARHLDDALRFAPDYAEGWVRRGQLYARNDEPSEALEALQRALTADPRHYRALLSLANTLDRMESPQGAYEAYGEALKVHPFLDEAQQARERLAPLVEGRGL